MVVMHTTKVVIDIVGCGENIFVMIVVVGTKPNRGGRSNSG